ENNHLRDRETDSLHFRLEGSPGLGKNEIVYALARQLGMELYMIQGHDEMTAEDLAVLVVPAALDDSRESDYSAEDYSAEDYSEAYRPQFELQASPLATAIYKGALFFFDEINRVPERALSPLSSVLDARRSIYSAMTGMYIKPKDEEA